MSKFMPYKTQKEEDLLKTAREYARLKLFNCSIDRETNCVIKYCKADSETQSEYLGKLLLQKAIDLIESLSFEERDGKLIS